VTCTIVQNKIEYATCLWKYCVSSSGRDLNLGRSQVIRLRHIGSTTSEQSIESTRAAPRDIQTEKLRSFSVTKSALETCFHLRELVMAGGGCEAADHPMMNIATWIPWNKRKKNSFCGASCLRQYGGSELAIMMSLASSSTCLCSCAVLFKQWLFAGLHALLLYAG